MTNINLGTPYEAKLRRIIEKGYAGNQTEAIRQAISTLEREIDEEEAILVHRGVQFEMEKMKGKRWTSHEQLKKELGWK